MRRIRRAVTLAGLLMAGALASAQTPSRPDPPPVFRLSVSLVQLDAVVTDRKGRHVDTLGPSDFIVLQDGRAQPVTAVAYVRSDEQFVDDTGAPLTGPPRSPRDARRVIAIVVDDLRMSFGSVYQTRRSLSRIIDELLLPDDLVGIVSTSGVRGTSWPLSFGRAELRAAANRLRFSLQNSLSEDDALDLLAGPFDMLPSIEYAHRERVFAMAALNRISEVIDAVGELPGRKTIVLVSEGFAMYDLGRENSIVGDSMRSLVDRANRAAVVIYAVDPRGLVVTGLTAADNPMSARQAAETAFRRSSMLQATQGGLQFVAGQTGGFAVINNNDIAGAMRRIMADQRGYYLIGYQPDLSTFGPGSGRLFRKLKIKVTRRGLKIRTRTGFYGVPTE